MGQRRGRQFDIWPARSPQPSVRFRPDWAFILVQYIHQVAAKVVTSTDKQTLQEFVKHHAAEDATVYTDEARACDTLLFDHEAVKHSVSECVRGQVHTNGME